MGGLSYLVGAPGFEPGASWTRTKRDTKLRHAPIDQVIIMTFPEIVKRIMEFPRKIRGICSFADILLNDLAQIPQAYNAGNCFGLFLLVLVVEINSVGTAISTFDLHIPAAFVYDQAVTTAAGAFFQNDILLIHSGILLYLKIFPSAS